MGEFSWLAGPVGGMLAVAFGTGCCTGYAFAIRTAFKAAKARIEELRKEMKEQETDCERRIVALENKEAIMGSELRELRSIVMYGPTPAAMRRQLDKLDKDEGEPPA